MSRTPAGGLRAPRWSGTTPVRRALSALLWEAGPTVAVPTGALLVVALVALTWGAVGGAPPPDGSGAAAVGATVGAFTAIAWLRAGSAQVPVLVAHGVTRAVVARAVVLGALASAAVLTVVMLAAAAVEIGVQGTASVPQGHAGVWAGRLLAAYTGLALLGAVAGVVLYRVRAWSGVLLAVAVGLAALPFVLGLPLVAVSLADAITPTGAWALLVVVAAAAVPLSLHDLALHRPRG